MGRLFSYLMTHDSGFAPNPFHGSLTLATCKPGIRKTKQVGDWVAGFASSQLVLGSRALGTEIPKQGLIFLMEITSVLPLEEYFQRPEFQHKKPSPSIDEFRNFESDYGDNIYGRDQDGNWIWHKNGNHHEGHKEDDVGGRNVLISKNFYYFGRNCFVPDSGWEILGVRVPVGPTCYGYKSEESVIVSVVSFLEQIGCPKGINGTPCLWNNKRLESRSRCSLR